MPCISALPYPNCTDHVSIFTTAVFVLSTLSPKRCFYKEAAPGCTMPANLTAENGFYPVLPNEMGNSSAYHGELLIDGAVNMTVSQSVTKVYLGSNATGSVRIDQDNVVVRGIDDHALQQLTIGAETSACKTQPSTSLSFRGPTTPTWRLLTLLCSFPFGSRRMAAPRLSTWTAASLRI